MDICTKINADELRLCLSTKTIDTKFLENRRRLLIYPTLRKYIVGDGKTLDGDALKKEVSPTDKHHYDIFISHSHNDLELVTKFAAYLEKECGLSVFLDSYAWKSADALLKRIDDDYCKTNDGKHYIYKRRNYSTSHVHAMLSMAILEMIDKTQCSVFVESENTLKLSNLKPTTKAETLSPWIYEELCMMKYVRRGSRIIEKGFSVNEGFEISHTVDVNSLIPISLAQLRTLDSSKNEWLEKLFGLVFGF